MKTASCIRQEAVLDLKPIHKNIIQGNFKLVKQAAFEFCDYFLPFFVGHLFQLPVGINGVYVMANKVAPVVQVYFYGFFTRADKPVFLYAMFSVPFFLINPVSFGGAGGEDFYNKVGSAINPVRFNFPPVTNHKIWDKYILFALMQVESTGNRDRFFAAQKVVKNRIDI